MNLILISALADICQHHALIRVEEAEWRKFFDPFGDFLCMVFVYACPYVCIPSKCFSPSTPAPPQENSLSFTACPFIQPDSQCQSLNAQAFQTVWALSWHGFPVIQGSWGLDLEKIEGRCEPCYCCLAALIPPSKGKRFGGGTSGASKQFSGETYLSTKRGTVRTKVNLTLEPMTE